MRNLIKISKPFNRSKYEKVIDLKKCPHCNSEATIAVERNLGIAVVCTFEGCGCQTPWISNGDRIGNPLDVVVKLWNTRPE